MTPKEFYEYLAGVSEPTTVNFQPGPVVLKVNAYDGIAARLLLWLYENMSENATQGDLDDVLDSAKWWAIFWSSLEDQDGSLTNLASSGMIDQGKESTHDT